MGLLAVLHLLVGGRGGDGLGVELGVVDDLGRGAALVHNLGLEGSEGGAARGLALPPEAARDAEGGDDAGYVARDAARGECNARVDAVGDREGRMEGMRKPATAACLWRESRQSRECCPSKRADKHPNPPAALPVRHDAVVRVDANAGPLPHDASSVRVLLELILKEKEEGHWKSGNAAACVNLVHHISGRERQCCVATNNSRHSSETGEKIREKCVCVCNR